MQVRPAGAAGEACGRDSIGLCPACESSERRVTCRNAGARIVLARVHRRPLAQSWSILRETTMKLKATITAIAFGVATVFVSGSLATQALAAQPSVLKTLDTDNDGTVDLAEAKAAASALFDRLDGDHDGTIDRKELRGRLSAKDLASADPDNDHTLTKGEYLALVEARFKAADHDNDGTLDAKELRSVIRLLK